MGKAVDALEDTMMKVELNDANFLTEPFMNGIFDEIYKDADGKPTPLPPLVDTMEYTFEHKLTPTMDGSKVLPYDKLNAELFYPAREENVETIPLAKKMVVELAKCLLKELRYPKR